MEANRRPRPVDVHYLLKLVDELASKQDDPVAAAPPGCASTPRARRLELTARIPGRLRSCQERSKKQQGNACEADEASIEKKFQELLVRLNATDDQLTRDLVRELGLRLESATPLQFGHEALCEARSSSSPRATRAMRGPFATSSTSSSVTRRVGVRSARPSSRSVTCAASTAWPRAGGAQDRAATTQRSQRPGAQDILLEQAAMERADGPSQYDYLRRLAARLVDIDRSEREAGRRGVAPSACLATMPTTRSSCSMRCATASRRRYSSPGPRRTTARRRFHPLDAQPGRRIGLRVEPAA